MPELGGIIPYYSGKSNLFYHEEHEGHEGFFVILAIPTGRDFAAFSRTRKIEFATDSLTFRGNR